MSDLIIPDSRFEMPELFYPNRKPVGNVEIDWGHPLAKGLTMCLVFQVGKGCVDLVSGRRASTVVGSVINPKGAYFDEVDDYIIIPDVVLDSNFSVTMDCDYTDNAGSLYQYVFSYGGVFTANSANYIIYEQSESKYPNQIEFNSNSSASSDRPKSAEVYPSNNHFTIAVSGVTADIYVEGRQDNVGAVYGTVAMADGTTRDLYLGARSDLDPDRFFGGNLKHTFIHNRRLSSQEAAALHANPYQFLIPR